MGRRTSFRVAALGIVAVVALTTSPASGAGFSIFEQGTKAMGMAGAFTAQADDGSAMFHNVGGIAFQHERSFTLGGTFIRNISGDFTGADPFPGSETSGELGSLDALVPHFYWVQPVTDTITFGMQVNSPFGLTTSWKNEDDWVGRFISTKATLRVIEVGPNVGFQVTPNFGIGVGAFARFSDVELNRRSAAINPFTLTPAEVAEVKLTSGFETGYGFQIGILHKAHPNFTWGLSYRSAMSIDYNGDAELTQVPTGDPVFDAVVASVTPFGQKLPVDTSISYPDSASLGLAFRMTENVLVEVDINWTGWSEFQQLQLDFVNDDLPDDVIPQEYEDSNNYRLGIRWTRSPRSELRFGYVFDETPQPDQSVGPLLPDADRNGFTVGYGRTGGKVDWDLAAMYLPFDKRTVSTNRDGFNGTYEVTGLLLAGTISF